MKTLAIASIVGSVILFIYLALSHVVLPVHHNDFKYTPEQESILSAMSTGFHEDGTYFLPNVPPGTSSEEHMKNMEQNLGKPYAIITYHAAMRGESPMIFIMSFVYNLISVLIICVALAAASSKLTSFRQKLWFVMLFAFFTIFSQIMLDYNWLMTPMHYLLGYIIDLIVGYLLVGIWLAWYYGRLARANVS